MAVNQSNHRFIAAPALALGPPFLLAAGASNSLARYCLASLSTLSVASFLRAFLARSSPAQHVQVHALTYSLRGS